MIKKVNERTLDDNQNIKIPVDKKSEDFPESQKENSITYSRRF